jgi:CubicO group peptidase (beta-lactamase class C family)
MNGMKGMKGADLNRCEPGDVGMSADRLANLARLTHRYVDEGKLPGVVTVVARRGRLAHLDAYGWRDVERAEPITADTIFRIFSMTKPIASAALMTLYEEGAFLLEDPVADYLPALRERPVYAGGSADRYEVRPAAREMTVLDLLRHTSGLIARSSRTPLGELYRRHGVADIDGDGDLAATVERLAELPLACDPGSEWIYGVSTDLVGRLCEVLSGQRFDDFLANRIFRPLGMADTGFTVPTAATSRFAANYRAAAGTPRYELLDDPHGSPYTRPRAYLSGAAGLVSTAGDYLRFAAMLLGGGAVDDVRVLGPRTVDLMTINHLPGGVDISRIGTHGGETRPAGHGFGLGFAVLLDRARAETVATPGEYSWGGAASTCFLVSPADDLFVLLLTQLQPSATYLRIRRELRSVAYAALVD